VIEKIILCFEEESIKEIYEIVINNFLKLACNSNGLCVAKKVISCTKSLSVVKILQEIIIQNSTMLIQNPHGNYTIQVALESWDPEYSLPIIHLFFGQLYTLSTMKFSSNVVEKCLEKGGDVVINKFMEEVCQKSKVIGNY
jgi:hypothetical protein